MNLTLIGDSLSAGNLGVPYSSCIDISTDYRIINHGIDGDTAHGILDRLENVLRSSSPDVLVVELGANDILLPAMRKKGGEWPSFVDEMISKGSVPATGKEDFEATYTDILSRVSAWGVENIVCTTIPPLGEGHASIGDEYRKKLNCVIRTLAGEYDAAVADVAEGFEEALNKIPVRSDWFFSSPADFTADLRRIRRDKSPENLSSERGLYLTIDGAHLNDQGAALMGKIVSEAITTLLDR